MCGGELIYCSIHRPFMHYSITGRLLKGAKVVPARTVTTAGWHYSHAHCTVGIIAQS